MIAIPINPSTAILLKLLGAAAVPAAVAFPFVVGVALPAPPPLPFLPMNPIPMAEPMLPPIMPPIMPPIINFFMLMPPGRVVVEAGTSEGEEEEEEEEEKLKGMEELEEE